MPISEENTSYIRCFVYLILGIIMLKYGADFFSFKCNRNSKFIKH